SLGYLPDGRAVLPHPLHNRDLRSLAPNKVNIFQRDIYLQAAFHLCPSGGLKGGGHHRPPARFSSNRRRIRFSSSMISAFSLGSSSGSWSSPRASRSICSRDRKSTRLNSSHVKISYAVFCLKKKIIHQRERKT